MSNELDFKHRVVFKKSALKTSGKRAKKKVYKASGESKHEVRSKSAKLSDEYVVFARRNPWNYTIRHMSRLLSCSEQSLRRAVKGETYKHLNKVCKPWK